jgi:transposase-like protein
VAESDQFKWRHYQGEIILLCVRWYLRYALSYRDLEEMMRERGLSLDHTTIYGSVSKNILATFHSSDELAGATPSCAVSEFLQQIRRRRFCRRVCKTTSRLMLSR